MIYDEARLAELKKYAFSVYILQALSFLLLVTAIVGVIVNYVKQEDVRGSWLESHFRWQKATFWYGLLWTVLGVLSSWIYIGYVVLLVVTIWLVYRIARGWIYLVDGKEMYLVTSGENNE
ncbi:MAG: hypothetical protein GY802_23375 [Gammaproteobacteria bacterium]|nr:hypothetical protein [Gammaproteobacteria bacterium]